MKFPTKRRSSLTCLHASGGPELYSVAEACQDRYLDLLMAAAADAGQPVEGDSAALVRGRRRGFSERVDPERRSVKNKSMRLAAPTTDTGDSPESWIRSLRRAGYTAGCAPPSAGTDPDVGKAYAAAAREADIVIAEVGAWSNPIDPDPARAREAIAFCQRRLDLAERLGARCCVNIAGSRHPTKWDGPHPENFSPDTFELIVQTTREIVDTVRPTRTFYTLETMPWIFPSSPDEYLALIRAIDRREVAVHLDPVNMINTPARAYRTGDFLRECFAKLGPQIKGAHAKDIILREQLTVHLDECLPGTGWLDYATFLREMDRLEPDTPLFIEHLAEAEYPVAATNLRAAADAIGIVLR